MVDSSESNKSKSSSNPIESWFTYLKSNFADFVDKQRMERLQDCRIIEDVFSECRRMNKTKSSQEDRMHLEDISPGIRILRYYEWRNVHDYDHKCSREKHAVWACRAGALQCGGELVQLRNCFNDLQKAPPDSNSNVKNHGAVLKASSTAYEPNERNARKDVPCREFQEKMGSCIAKNASELAEREISRAKSHTDAA
jgi:hypothetical protein